MSENTTCENWEFYEIENGYMLNCTPEFIIQYDDELLIKLKQLANFNF